MEKLGAFVINADTTAHNVYKPGKPCHQQLVGHFGGRIVGEDGEIDRKILGEIVFKNAVSITYWTLNVNFVILISNVLN